MENNMTTPCEELGYKVGDTFRTISNAFNRDHLTNELVQLVLDDGTDVLQFRLLNGRLIWIPLCEIIKSDVGYPPPFIPTTTNKYVRTISGVDLDVYDILKAWNVTCPATQHAIKKLLMPGQRGHKDKLNDLEEAHAAIQRAIELEAL